MLYIAKGTESKQSGKETIIVSHCGIRHILTNIGARLWLAGRFGIGTAEGEREIRHLRELQKLGLTEMTEEDGPLAVYRLLARCVICPSETASARSLFTPMERRTWQWISKAGLRLSIGELTKLAESGVSPSAKLLGIDNAQDLTMLIYRDGMTLDTTPDTRMEASPKRDVTVNAVLGLLRKKRLTMI